MKNTASGIFLFNSDNKFLVEHPTNHDSNLWSIPKGMIESGENPYDAALRETFEETSLDIQKIQHKIVGELPIIKYKSKRKSIIIFVIKTTDNLYDFPFSCDSMVTQMGGKKLTHPFPEVDDFKWISIDDGYNLLHESQVRALDMIKELFLI